MTYGIRAIGWVDPRTVEQKSNTLHRFPLAFAEGVHELLQGSGALDLEEDLIIVVGDFDVEVLGFGLVLRVGSPAW